MIITGHTGKIGSHLFDMFPYAVGMSRGTGWDIADKERIIAEAANHDTFISCAHGQGFQQAELMLALFDAYRHEDKLFINIGTDAAYAHKWSMVYEQYPVEKSALAAACEHLQNLPHVCRITLIEPNDIREFNIGCITAAIRFVIEQAGMEIKNIRFHGRGKR